MSSPDLAPQGPPKKGSGPRPTMSQMFTAPKVQIQETKTVPLIDLQKLEADVTLLEAKKKAEQKKKAAAVVIPKSVPSVELKISEVAPVASLASASDSVKTSAPPAEKSAQESSVLPNLFGLGSAAPPSDSVKTPAQEGEEDAVKVVPQKAKLDAFLDDEGPAQDALAKALMKSEKPVDDKAFLNLKAAVETKVGATPIRVTPREKIFMPATRRSIHQFVIETYSSYILKKPNPDLVGDACKELSRVSAATVENFKYQEFVRDYMQKGSPYRGLLVYHGLGSGKTCTSIAAEEALRFGGMRKIFILTPASLSGNYKKELALCGYYAFKKDNNWEKVEVPLLGKYGDEKEEIDTASSQFAFLTDTYGLSADYILNKWRNYKVRTFWVANPSGPVNFGSFSAEEQKDIEKQIDAHMSTRFEFIKYNGLREKKIREWICGPEGASAPRVEGSAAGAAGAGGGQPKNIFDGAVVVIDEVHNIVRGIVGSNLEQFFKVEPRQPNYVGTFCGTPRKYRIMYGLYRLLCNAVGCKIIALSGTPIINKPHEIGVLSNILAGDRRVARISLNPAVNTSALENVMKRQPEVDFYKYEQVKEGDNAYLQLTISPVPSGFTKVVDEATGTLKGFMRMEEREDEEQMARERNLEEWFARVAPAIGAGNIVGEPRFEALPQLPDTEKEFIESFVDRKQLKIMNPISLKSRLTGLISYYKGSKKELVARVTTDEVVYLDMSEWQLSKYQALRKDEIETETDTKKPEGGQTVGGLAILYGDAYAQATKSVNSSFKIFSRAACNFVFPDGISRPTPKDSKKAAALLGVRDEGGEKGDEGESEEHELAAAQVVEESHDTRAAKLEGFLSEEDTKEEEEQRAVAKQATALLDREITQASMEYGEQVQASLDALRARAAEIFVPEKLSEYSPKYAAILEKVRQSKGPALIYSNFKTLEGLGIFGIACEYQTNPGYVRLDIKKEGTEWVLADALKAPENKGKERFILYSGDDAQDKREILRDIFNWDIKKLPASLKKDLRWLAGGQPNNFTGKICRMFMITQSGAEGISLKNVRQVHIMEPFWNYVRLEQVQGRAIRICSHKDLPLAERTVDVFTYLMRFSEVAKRDRKVDESIFVRDKGMTTDEIIYTLMLTKRKLNEQMFEIMKDSAIDCMLNALEHGSKSCFIIRSGGPLFLYDPDYRVDIAASSSTFRTTDSEVVPVLATSSSAPQSFEKEVAEPSEASLPPGLSGAAETRVAPEARVEAQAVPEEQPQLNAVQEANAGQEVLSESEGADTNVEEALEANAAAQEAQQQEGLNKPI